MLESKCDSVIKNMIKLVEDVYPYTEIIKNPPNPDYFDKFDLISDLKKVILENRKYLDFYRDIRRITAKMKDLHFNTISIPSKRVIVMPKTAFFCRSTCFFSNFCTSLFGSSHFLSSRRFS